MLHVEVMHVRPINVDDQVFVGDNFPVMETLMYVSVVPKLFRGSDDRRIRNVSLCCSFALPLTL